MTREEQELHRRLRELKESNRTLAAQNASLTQRLAASELRKRSLMTENIFLKQEARK